MPSVDKTRVIFACYPSLYSVTVLSQLLSNDNIEVCGVIESTCIKRRSASNIEDIVNLIASSGIRYSVYLWCVTDLFALIGKLRGTATLGRLCRAFSIPVYRTSDINSPSSCAAVSQMGFAARSGAERNNDVPTYFVTTMFNQKLSQQVLGLSGLSFVNLHPGRLPNYRGVDPVLDALVNDDANGVVSLHRTAIELDTGELLAEVEVPLDPNQSLVANNLRFFDAGANMLSHWLQQEVQSDDRQFGKEQKGDACYRGWPDPSRVGGLKRLILASDLKQLTVDMPS